MDDKFKELLRIAYYAGNECHKYAWSINEQFAEWYEANETKLKNLCEGEAGTGYALLSDESARTIPKWNIKKIREWLIDVDLLIVNNDTRMEGIRQLEYLINQLKKEE